MKSLRPVRRAALAAASLAAASGVFAVLACSIPVFYYALENWPADPYAIEIAGEIPTEGEAKAAENLLRKILSEQTVNAVMPSDEETEPGDGAAPDPASQAETEGEAKVRPPAKGGAPQLVVRYYAACRNYGPDHPRLAKPVWTAPLTRANVARLLDSPARREIARRLLAREAAVWVFLESGDKKKDAAAVALLAKEIKALADTLELPEGYSDEDYAQYAEYTESDGTEESEPAPPSRAVFSMLRLRRNDPAEGFLVASLLASEKGLAKLDEPMAFPVFGRGVVLEALVGEGIHSDNIAETCAFLVGPCSCIIKGKSFGTDLLTPVIWDEHLSGDLSNTEIVLPPLVGIDALVDAEADPASPEALSPGGSALVSRNVLVLAGLGLLVVIGGTLVAVRLKGRERN